MELTTDEAVVEATALDRANAFIASIGDYPDIYHGRGVVMCGGGRTYFTNAWLAISSTRSRTSRRLSDVLEPAVDRCRRARTS